MNKIRIATRKSKLALWQANYIKNKLIKFYPNLEINIVSTCTTGDKILNKTLSKIGGKGLFIKELENLLLENLADIAIHSIKDVPMKLNKAFELVAITKRINPLDSFVSNKYKDLQSMISGSVVGTSSLRREAQIRAIFPKIIVKPLRGNIQTRLNKLDKGNFDAIILATAGLQRLNLIDRINVIDENIILPAVGQGSLGIEILRDKNLLKDMLSVLNHKESAYCIYCERIFSRLLEGSCNLPLAGYATIVGDKLNLKGLVAKQDGSLVLTSVYQDDLENFEAIAEKVANDLICKGAKEIISSL